ncbi:MAG: threonine/serine dehydratase [Dehalococcoidia bacterium]|nr:threonine/serine dehydratase [Dehalococcoidia bacterium]MDW8120663.1 threonine/serine dehydratase [Chloroflexota bacterium]
MERPTLQDVLRARKIIAPYLPPTPLQYSPALSDLLGAEVYLKREDLQPIGAFKVRGGVHMLLTLPASERQRGVITASTGNHGQSIAYAARLVGAQCTIVMPQGANPLKARAIRRLGAQVLYHGQVFEDAREYAERLAQDAGLRYIHAVNEPLLIAGVATETVEILEAQPDIQAIFVPVGGGSGAAGASIVAKAVNPAIRVIAVQSAQAPAAYLSWKERRLVEAPMHTFAEGLATRQGYALTQRILWDLLDDFLLVSDEEIRQAMRLYLTECRIIAEGAGAAPLAGALQARERIRGQRVALIVSGGNVPIDQVRALLTSPGA